MTCDQLLMHQQQADVIAIQEAGSISTILDQLQCVIPALRRLRFGYFDDVDAIRDHLYMTSSFFGAVGRYKSSIIRQIYVFRSQKFVPSPKSTPILGIEHTFSSRKRSCDELLVN